jgi:hypothetical protein
MQFPDTAKVWLRERTMKIGFKIGLGIIAAVVLVVVVLGAGWLLWGRRLWMPGLTGRLGTTWSTTGCGGSPAALGRNLANWDEGPGMMYGNQG